MYALLWAITLLNIPATGRDSASQVSNAVLQLLLSVTVYFTAEAHSRVWVGACHRLPGETPRDAEVELHVLRSAYD